MKTKFFALICHLRWPAKFADIKRRVDSIRWTQEEIRQPELRRNLRNHLASVVARHRLGLL